MKKINNYHDLFNAIIPAVVKNDCQKRIYDWIKDGGHFKDSYVQERYRYASMFL